MAIPHELNILEQCKISPSSSPTPTTISLSFYDLPWIAWFYSKPVYFYNFHHSKSHFIETTLPKLKTSLSITLQHFYPLAGHLIWPHDSNKPQIIYKDGDSVSLTIVQSDCDFHHLSSHHPKDVNEYDTLVPKFSPSMSSDDKLIPLLALQVTLFPDKGISIGFSFHHVVVDGRSATNFIKLWAEICKFEGDMESFVIPDEFLPVVDVDKALIKDPKALEKMYVNGVLEEHIMKKENLKMSNVPIRVTPFVDIVRATFVLGCSEIKKLKEFVLAHLTMEDGVSQRWRFSAFVVTVAYVWVCNIKAKWGENHNESSKRDEMEYLISAVDCRARLDPTLPASYFGNCLGTISVMARTSDLLGENGIAIAAELIAKYIQEIDECVWKALEKGMSYIRTLPRDGLFSTAGSHKFGYYKRDFGWGKPRKVEVMGIENQGGMSMSECPNEEGAIEIGLVRNKTVMAAFESAFAETLKALP